MIMGLNSNLKRWPHELIEGLVNQNLYVITYDNRDTGKSTWVTEESTIIKIIKKMPTFIQEPIVDWFFDQMLDEEGRFNMGGVPSEYNLEDMALDGIALLDHLKIDKAHIVGASMGGMIAQVISLNHPERVMTLTGIMTTPGFDTAGLSGPYPHYINAMRESFLLNLQSKPKESSEVVNLALIGPSFLREEYENLTKILKSMEKHGNNPDSGHMAAVGSSPNRLKRLKEISIPTLIIHGTEDPLIPVDHGLAISEQIQNSEKLIINGMGHNFPTSVIPVIIEQMIDHFDG
jgi:pimeloyl-ACP methyl ester carboxylesterase